MLEFEHIIQINDPDQPQIPVMSRTQLWEGLLFRAKYPGHFNAALDSRVENLSNTGFTRVLQIGNRELRDEVMLEDELEIRTSTGHNQSMYAESITRIEEPAPGYLFVRFMYRRDSGNSDGIDVDEYLKAAYVQNDRDAVIRLREFAQTGLPGTGSWVQ